MPKYPKIGENFEVIKSRSNEYLLQSHLGSVLLQEPWTEGLLRSLLPLLSGEYSISEVISSMEDSGFAKEDVKDTLRSLEDKGILEEADRVDAKEDKSRYADQIKIFSNFQPDGREIQNKLDNSKVLVVGLGNLGSNLVRSLTLAGIGKLTGIDSAEVSKKNSFKDSWFSKKDVGKLRREVIKSKVQEIGNNTTFKQIKREFSSFEELKKLVSNFDSIVLALDRLDPQTYEEFNKACISEGSVWTSCRVSGFEIRIGPTVIPNKTPCFKCYKYRRKANLANYQEQEVLEEHARTNSFKWETFNVSSGTDLASLEVLKHLGRFAVPATYGKIFSMNLLTLESSLDPILKAPNCPHCGKPSKDRPEIFAWGK